MVIVRQIVFLLGVATVVATFGSAVRTVVIPRGIPARLARFVFFQTRRLFRLRARPKLPYEKRDRVMALYGPVSLLILLITWIALVLFGYTGMYWGLSERSLGKAFSLSGSSVLTLGFEAPTDLPTTALVFGIPFNPTPRPGDDISIGRDEFDGACEALATQGIPLKEDREQAWMDFSGWRVNYDPVLLALAGLTMAPYAPWSSDRSIRDWRP